MRLICAIAVGGLAVFGLSIPAQTVPTPGLTVGLVGTNQVKVTITNGVSWANYELYRRTVLDDPAYPWTLHIVGAQGATNFTASMGSETIGFFEVAVGSDWDQDGIPNSQDGNPINAGVGILTITIDSPLDGFVFN